MDDDSLKNLMESKNELCSRLLNIFTPCLFSGINSLLDEAYNICIEKTLFSEIIFLVKTFFFVYLGISIKFGQIYFMSIGLVLTIIIYASRLFLVKYLTPKETSQREAALIAFIIPKGLAAAVLAEIPIHMDLGEKSHALFLDVQSIVYAVIFFSILLTAILIYREENRNSSSPFIKQFFKKFKPTTSPIGE